MILTVQKMMLLIKKTTIPSGLFKKVNSIILNLIEFVTHQIVADQFRLEHQS